jgi:sodium/potassium/calcium exchanger 2
MMLDAHAKRKRCSIAPARSAVFFTCMLGLAVYYNSVGGGAATAVEPARRLESTDLMFGLGYPIACEGGAVVLYILGVLYLFAGIAIVCDEFFVPALEVLTEVTGVSDDVAGATFMAAGGSAPELFTSIIGTFKQSSVGLGTIIGSAVFNVLFVIGCCAICSKELLTLTWWPLARDSSYYCLSLVILAIFFQDGTIEWWEALILFLMYFGYVTVMKYNDKLHAKMDSSFSASAKVTPNAEQKYGAACPPTPELGRAQLRTRFKTGLLSQVTGTKSLKSAMQNAMVIQVSGNIRETFDQIDADHSGFIDEAELRLLMAKCEVSTAAEARACKVSRRTIRLHWLCSFL